MNRRSSNSSKTPRKNGVVGANKNDAHELEDEKKLLHKQRKEKNSRQKNLILLKKKKKEKNSKPNLPEGLKVKGWFGN